MHTYIIINTSNGGVCVEFEKKYNTGFPCFKLPESTNQYLMTGTFNIIFDHFGL